MFMWSVVPLLGNGMQAPRVRLLLITIGRRDPFPLSYPAPGR